MKRARDPNDTPIVNKIGKTENAKDHTISFPTEVLEVLFANLSLTDLYHCQLVCHRWNDIISRDGYLVWRKLYYKVKIKGQDDDVKQFVQEQGLLDQSHFVERIVRSMNLLFHSKFNLVEIKQVLALLMCHPQYPIIKQSPLFQNLLKESEEDTLLITAVSLVLLSKDVFETKQVFDSLLQSYCIQIISELFFGLATLFYHLWRIKVIPQRLHYQTYYVLKNFLFRGDTSVTLTEEQNAIVKHPILPGHVWKIIALAGTGKTTSLIHLAHENSSLKFLYLCYNKSVQESAQKVFGSNVKCQTFHSLAFRTAGSKYKHKLIHGNFNANHVSKAVDKQDQKILDHLSYSKYIVQTLECFMASSDSVITEDHVPEINEIANPMSSSDQQKLTKMLVTEACSLWCKMKDVKDKDVHMPHDGYLKVYQLQSPQILGCDCILVDEAQDITPAIISVVQGQTCPKVFVGDPYQQIYGFRGAVSALRAIEPTHTFYLTKSFRFGPNIAFITSCLLEALKGVHTQTLTGGFQSGGYSGISKGQVAYIARTNLKLFCKMVRTIQTKPDAKLGFAGGVEGYDFDSLIDIYRLRTKSDLNLIKNGLIKKFASSHSDRAFQQLMNYAEHANDVTLKSKIKLCLMYVNIPSLIDEIKSRVVDISVADIVFSTAHKSKGLEFDTVVLTDDYLEGAERSNNGEDIDYTKCPEDEQNLLYVAITRAKKQLFFNDTVPQVLSLVNEHLVVPSVMVHKPSCVQCGRSLMSTGCCMFKESIVLAEHHVPLNSGPLCCQCSIQLVPHLSKIVKCD